MRRWALTLILALALLVGMGAWLGPRALSVYYVEKGGRALDESLRIAGRAPTDDPWLAPTVLTQTEAIARADRAMGYLQKAVAAHPAHAQAYRWQGRAALLLDQPDVAEEAFAEYVRLKPENRLGYWELGLAYERMARLQDEATYWELDLGLDDTPDPGVILYDTQPLTGSLKTARVGTPDAAINTPYCETGSEPSSCFVAPTVWEMPVANPDAPLTLTEPVRSEVLFMHPPSQATWQLTLPVTPTTLGFWMGLQPDIESYWGDGVTFQVQVNGEAVFEHHLTAEEARAGWQPGQADLTPWTGESVALTLSTDAGPQGDGAGDWAGWGAASVVVGDAYRVPPSWIRAAWGESDVDAQNLLSVGEESREVGEYPEALDWYHLSGLMGLNRTWLWYYGALAYEGMSKWDEASHWFEWACDLGNRDACYALGKRNADLNFWSQALDWFERGFLAFSGQVGLSNIYHNVGFIYQHHQQPIDMVKAWKAYEKAISLNDYTREGWRTSDQLRASTYFQRGLLLSRQSRWAEAISEYSEALTLSPEGYWIHLNKSWALWKLGKTQEAEAAALLAVGINGEIKNAYRLLAIFYESEGELQKAEAVYQQILLIDPDDQEAVKFFESED